MPRKKNQKATVEEHVPSIYDHFGIDDPDADKRRSSHRVAKKDDKSSDNDAQIAALQKRLDDLSRANVALMSQAPQTVQNPEAPKPLDLSGMPDPVSDPVGYNTELNKRVEARISSSLTYNQHQSSTAQDQQKKFDSLWTDFSNHEQYGDIAKHEDRVKFIAGQLVEEAKGRGMDPQKYVLTGREQFFGDIASRYEKIFGKEEAEVSEKDDDVSDKDTDDGRATSILGGMESGFASGTKATGKEQLGDMTTDLKDIQRRSGFY
jgi:hypothetical protein